MLNSIREAKGVSQEGHGREIEEDNLSSIGGQTSLSTRFSKSKLRDPKIKLSRRLPTCKIRENIWWIMKVRKLWGASPCISAITAGAWLV